MATVKSIGVIGAGQMGNGIAHVAALSGFNVVLLDISAELTEKGLATIKKNMDRQVAKEVISEGEKNDALKRIKTTTDNKDFSDCDLVIEAATENLELKTKILTGVCKALKKQTIIATNTSSISITKLAAATDRPEKFMGMHFMNPVPLMKLVELIPGIATNKETFEAVNAVA
ncbi:MAG: 3-hydroxyacyl-CoA dehydrogenase NAD-binding domain-containing protein, partial [Alphaproteobacteria bacterium]